MPGVGVEPTRPLGQSDLNRPRLPVTPPGRGRPDRMGEPGSVATAVLPRVCAGGAVAPSLAYGLHRGERVRAGCPAPASAATSAGAGTAAALDVDRAYRRQRRTLARSPEGFVTPEP